MAKAKPGARLRPSFSSSVVQPPRPPLAGVPPGYREATSAASVVAKGT
ncbi:hypothetical protein [Leptolyngbya sp. O-77]|nr:hypothetical protein [Leptolyngbya sp. O-77]